MNIHINQLKESNYQQKNSSGKDVKLIKIIVPGDENVISKWANHLRKQYCEDEELEELIKGTGKSKSLFLKVALL